MKSSHYFKLGLFVLIGAGLLCAAVLVLGAGRFLDKPVPAESLFDESVDGLEVGSPVKYRGVMIGRVTSIAFAADTNDSVRPEEHHIARYVLVDMSLDSGTFRGMSLQDIHDTFSRMARQGLRARVATQGIGGGVYIGLDFVDAGAKPPPEIRLRSNALYIPSAPSTMNQVMSAAERLASDLRQANLPRLVEHMDGLVVSAEGTAEHVHQFIDENQATLKTAVSDLPGITGGLKSTVSRTDQLLRDQRIDRALGNVASDSAAAGKTLDDLQRTSEELRTLIATRQEDIDRIISDLRRTADNLAALSTDARDNPSGLLLGAPPPHKQPGQ